MIPHQLFRLPVSEGTRLTLCALYGDVDDPAEVRAWEDGRARLPPFVWRLAGYDALVEALDRARSSIADDLARLAKLGVIRRARRDGRSGWELLGTRGGDAGSARPDVQVRPAGPPSPKSLTPRSARPDPSPKAESAQPDPRVRPAGPPSPPSRTPESAQPDPLLVEQSVNSLARAGARSGAGEAVADRPVRRRGSVGAANEDPKERPAPPAVQGPARARLLEIASELDVCFTPTTAEGEVLESRRLRPTATVLRLLAQLLAPPPDVAESADLETWLERRIDVVRGYVRDYARICEVDPEQARCWGPDMLCDVARKGDRSAWTVLTRIVDRWRAGEAEARKNARERDAAVRQAEARDVAELLAKLEHRVKAGDDEAQREWLARAGRPLPRHDHRGRLEAARAAQAAASAAGRLVTLAELHAAVEAVQELDEPTPLPPAPPPLRASPTPERRELTPDEEAAVRQHGRRRQADAEDAVIERARQLKEAIKLAEQLAGRELTSSEKRAIRDRIYQETGT